MKPPSLHPRDRSAPSSPAAEPPLPRLPVSLGRHRLLFAIGHGGMSDVYLALVNSAAGVNKLLVIKKLRASLLDEPEALSMFLDEGRLAARLHHPNVVQTFEVGREGPIPYLTMEFLDGQPLHRVQRRLGVGERTDPALAGLALPGGSAQSWAALAPLTLAMRLRIITEMLEGLHYAHELCDYDGSPLRVVHRDVSPQNLFITYDGQIKLVDFGIAKAVDSITQTVGGGLKGKLAYMSPQQARGEVVDRRADLFAAGVMLWELLSGRRLWSTASEIPLARRLVAHELPSLDIEGLPAELVDICRRALAPAADDRYATAALFQRDIESFMTQASLDASPRAIGKRVCQAFTAERQSMRQSIDGELLRLVGGGTDGPTPALSPAQLWHMPAPSDVGQGPLDWPEETLADPGEVTADLGPAPELETLAVGVSPPGDPDGEGATTPASTPHRPGSAQPRTKVVLAVVSAAALASLLSIVGAPVVIPSNAGGANAGEAEPGTSAVTPAGDCESPDKPLIELSGELDRDATLRCDRDYLLRFQTRVASGATLTIEAGTTIRGDHETKGTLIVQPGARLVAKGSPDRPIVFTSDRPLGSRAPGDWGGVVLLGNAPTNLRDAQGHPIRGHVEGLTVGGDYGGDQPNDDSGELRYVRIEYPGIELAPANELNGLTLAGIGRGTTLDHIQVRATTDDCFEFFGGTVNGHHLVCDDPGDDGFDFDFGYQGRLQYLVTRDAWAKAPGSHAFEVDNDPNGTPAEPRTRPQIWNATACGAPSGADALRPAIAVRRAATPVFRALVIGGFDHAVDLRDPDSVLDLEDLALVGGTTLASPGSEQAWMGELRSSLVHDPQGAPPCSGPAPDAFLPTATISVRGAMDPLPSEEFFQTPSPWFGAFGAKDWTAGSWVVWSEAPGAGAGPVPPAE